MTIHITWLPSTDPAIASYKLQSSPDSTTWSDLAVVTHAIPGANWDAVNGVFYYNDVAGTSSTWYHIAATDNLAQMSDYSAAFRAAAMPGGSLTLLQLRTMIRQRCDMVNSTFVTDAELNSYINQSAYELYDILIEKYGDEYFLKLPAPTGTFDGTSLTYALPSDFYKLLGVDLLVSSPDWWVTLRPFEMAERNRFALRNFQSFYGLSNLRYKLAGSNLWFSPIAASGQQYRIWYIPRWIELVADTDILDGISGWTEYVIVDCCIKCLQKEESDPSVFMVQKQALLERIEVAAGNRDAGMPHTVSDTMRANPWTPWGGPLDGQGGNW